MDFQFLGKKDTVALDIGSSSIKLVQMAESKQGWELEKLGIAELPPEAIVDGSIIDSMTVINTLRDLLTTHGVKAKDAVSSLTGHSVIIKKVSLPAMTEDELAESIQWEAEQYIPFPIGDVNLDFQFLGIDSAGRGQMDVMLVAVKKDVINDYTNVVREAGLNPVVIDVDSFALENMMEINYPITPTENIAVVNIGASITSASVIMGGMTVFTRSIPMGGNQYTEEIQRQLNINFSDADSLKVGGEVENVETDLLPNAIETVSGNITAEVKRSIDFFLGSVPGSSVNKVYLSGGSSKIEDLQAMMQDRTLIPVELVHPFANVVFDPNKFDPGFLKSMAPNFGIGVGLAVRRAGDK